MAKAKILVCDDEPDIQELIRFNLEREGFEVVLTASGEDCIKEVEANNYELLVLDLMLPGIDGLEVCRRVMGNDKIKLPIIMVSAKGEEADVVLGLELGADDYVVKPFSPRVLIARVRSVIRRATMPEQEDDVTELRFNDLVIIPEKFEVTVQGKSVSLTSTEFNFLHVMAMRPGRVFTRYQIVDAVRGSNYPVTERSVDVQVAGLRKKLGPCSHYVETVRGIGYRFKEPE